MYLFQLSLEKGVFPDDLKFTKVTMIYNAGDSGDRSNYRPISVLPCFPKILERLKTIASTRISKNDILYKKN